MPTSLANAFELDKTNALAKHRRNIERLAELMAMKPSTLYSHIEHGAMPVGNLLIWQHLTGSDAVVRYLAASAHKVVIDIPTGRKTDADDVHLLQATLNGAIGALLDFMKGELDRDTALAALGAGLESLAWHRENVRKFDQPELDLS